MLTFFIPGRPVTVTAQQKGVRVVAGKPSFYTKREVHAAETALAMHLPRPDHPFDGPLSVALTFVFPRRTGDARGPLVPMFQRPDLDNMVKLILDTMTRRGFWRDDAQICHLTVSKYRGADPGTLIVVEPMTVKTCQNCETQEEAEYGQARG